MHSMYDELDEVCRVVGEAAAGPFPMREARRGRSPSMPDTVARSVAENVIRRLVGQTGVAPGVTQVPEDGAAADRHQEIERLCDALVSDDPRAAARLVEEALLSGARPATLYVDVVAIAARRLGERWLEDTASFFEVTLGLGRLHGILHMLGPSFFADAEAPVAGRTAIFAPVPGETHILGLVMAADFFRRGGWQVDLHTNADLDQLTVAASSSRVAMIGLSASSRRMMEPLAETVLRLRAVCGAARIVVGGHLTELEPAVASAVGADGVAGDAPTAAVALQPLK